MSDRPPETWLQRAAAGKLPVRAEGGTPLDEPRIHRVRRPPGWEFRPMCGCAFCVAESAGRVLDTIRRAA